MKIMFICTGNICRSAMAEVMFHDMIEKENLKNIEIYSCGIYADNGDIPTENAIQAMKEYEIDLTHHRATNIKNSEIENMDLILCATLSHKVMVEQLYKQLKGKIFTIKEYAKISKEGQNLDISDPWGYDLQTYQKCATEIHNCLTKIIKEI